MLPISRRYAIAAAGAVEGEVVRIGYANSHVRLVVAGLGSSRRIASPLILHLLDRRGSVPTVERRV